jgi:hypothetical protein
MRATLSMFVLAAAATQSACSVDVVSPAPIGLCAVITAPLNTASPNFTAVVSRVTYNSSISPMGPLSQHEVWLTIPPSAMPNAGVVIGRNAPVLAQSGSGPATAVAACTIAIGDRVQVWHDGSAAYGSAQAPPESPAYFGTQLVIAR